MREREIAKQIRETLSATDIALVRKLLNAEIEQARDDLENSTGVESYHVQGAIKCMRRMLKLFVTGE